MAALFTAEVMWRQKLLEPIFDPQVRDAGKVLEVGANHRREDSPLDSFLKVPEAYPVAVMGFTSFLSLPFRISSARSSS
jgi:hypothetical protein